MELAADFRQSGLHVTLDLADLPRSLANDQAFALYKLCQEAFTNAVRHGRAGKAQVNLRCLGGRLVLRVTDNGVGCDQPNKGGGLAGMEQRVRSLNGSIAFGRAPEGGFKIEAEMPCEVTGND